MVSSLATLLFPVEKLLDLSRAQSRVATFPIYRAFPPDGLKDLDLRLFFYRNKMFHNGFEWPRSECLNFAKRIEERKWEGWFGRSEHGDEPWIFYMSDDFIRCYLEMIDKILDACLTIPVRTGCR